MIRIWENRIIGMVRCFLLLGLLILFPLSIFANHPSAAKSKKFTLVIDAGHGGHDAGALGKLTKEKHINLNVALAFGRKVEANCPDVKVIYTRKTDVFVPLHTRADIANRAKADLFISIHTNSVPKRRIVRGMETYTLGMHRAADNLEVAKRENEVILYEKDYRQRYQGFDPSSSESYIMFEFIQDKYMAQSVDLAKYIQRRTCASAGRTNKGVKQAGFLVLRETSMPSCLIELGFISTPDEEQFLNSRSGVEQMAQGIYQAFVDYKKQYHQGAAQPLKVETQAATVSDAQQARVVDTQQSYQEETKKEKKSSRKKSKMAEQLEAAREGELIVQTVYSEPIADSIINATPQLKPAKVESQTVDVVKRQEVAQKQEPARVVSQTVDAVKRQEVVQKQEPAPEPVVRQETLADVPVFKVQILASGYKLKDGDAQLKGVKGVDFYQENGLYKYTVGSSDDYSQIYQMRKTVVDRFPQAFIVAFKNGQKYDLQAAMREYRSRQTK